jgi:hypothetical protein
MYFCDQTPSVEPEPIDPMDATRGLRGEDQASALEAAIYATIATEPPETLWEILFQVLPTSARRVNPSFYWASVRLALLSAMYAKKLEQQPDIVRKLLLAEVPNKKEFLMSHEEQGMWHTLGDRVRLWRSGVNSGVRYFDYALSPTQGAQLARGTHPTGLHCVEVDKSQIDMLYLSEKKQICVICADLPLEQAIVDTIFVEQMH